MTEGLDGITDSMVNELKQTPGDSEGQGSLVCCSPWSHKESDTTERLNITAQQHNSKRVKTAHMIINW